jgi:hypothetical protein
VYDFGKVDRKRSNPKQQEEHEANHEIEVMSADAAVLAAKKHLQRFET